MAPEALVERLASAKAREVSIRHPQSLVIGADTIVTIGGEILGKPRDRAQAVAMLEQLSGRVHTVFTGVALLGDGRELVAHEATQVRFRELSRPEIDAYVDSGEPIDKAGAYGVQGLGAALVESVQGDYYAVVGLPICRTVQMLSQFGVKVL